MFTVTKLEGIGFQEGSRLKGLDVIKAWDHQIQTKRRQNVGLAS